MRSIYRWKGNIEREQEFLLVIKTTSEQASRLEAVFQDLHPYEMPERVELSVEGGSEAYLSWITGEVEGEEA
jgi:periplasmic divalent cation tolerance protein